MLLLMTSFGGEGQDFFLVRLCRVGRATIDNKYMYVKPQKYH